MADCFINLSIVYRASFCRTFSEMAAPTGEWKTIWGTGLSIIALAFWIMYLMKKTGMHSNSSILIWFMNYCLSTVYGPLPESCSPENRERQVEYYIKMRVDPIDGISAKWDYEKDQWKE